MPLSDAAKAAYWKEREARWSEFVKKLGRPPATSDYAAFSKSEKPFQKALTRKKTQGTRRQAASCPSGEEPKMVFGTPRCAATKKESVMSIRDRMNKLTEGGVAEGHEKQAAEWDKLSTLLDPVIAQTKKVMQMQGKVGASADANEKMLRELLNAAVTVRKWADGD